MATTELPNLMQIRTFAQVAESGSISKACEQLLRAQSVVTRSLQDLETRLGVQLFERHARGVLLTEFGGVVWVRAQRILGELASTSAATMRGHAPINQLLFLLNTRRLEIFAKLFATQNMRTVAADFGLTQPAISSTLKVLENGIDKPLFERTARGLQPTRTANEIILPVRRALNELRRIDDDIAAHKGNIQGTVTIGALPLGRTRILPEAILDTLDLYPDVKVNTNESTFYMLAQELRAGDIDFIFGALRPSEQADDLYGEELLSEEMVIVARSGHPILSKLPTPHELERSKWVLPRRETPARRLLDAHFLSIGISPPEPVVESGDLAIIRGLLLRSEMLAIVSKQQLEHEIALGELRSLPLYLGDTKRAIGLTFRKNCFHSPAAERLIAAIRKAASHPA